MNNIEVFPFTNEHIDDVTKISALSFTTPWSRESMEKELYNVFSKYVVAKIDNRIIGFGGMWLIIDEGHITNIAVHPEFREYGVGSKILQGLIHICNEHNAHAMTLEVRSSNLPAQGLYKKYGFLEEGIRKKYYEDTGEDAILMWKRDVLKTTV